MPQCGTSGGKGGRSVPADRAAESTAPTMAATHWTELTDANAKGLPAKPWGRTAIAVAPCKPQVVFAMIECEGQRAVPLG